MGKHFGSLLLLAILVFTSEVYSEKPTPVEIAKIGKAAIAFVKNPSGSGRTGGAVCVDSAGLFVTNRSVVESAKEEGVSLVLNPGQKSQKTLKARVVYIDKENQLALLMAETEEKLPSVSLAPRDDALELTEVVVFGFRFGLQLSDKSEFPPLNVFNSRIISLLSKEGVLLLHPPTLINRYRLDLK